MQKRFLAPVILMLSACASTPPSVPAPSVGVSAPVERPSGAEGMLANAGATNAATMDAVVRALGAPDVQRQDGAGAALTYRLDGCAMLLLFNTDARGAMRLSQANVGPRRPADPAPTLAQCAAAAETRRASMH